MKISNKEEVHGGMLLKEGHTTLFRMCGNSMYPFLKDGDIGMVQKCDPDQLKVGDIVVFKCGKSFIAHRLIRIENQHGEVIFTTKGDKNILEDPPFPVEDLCGQLVRFVLNKKIFSPSKGYLFTNSIFGDLQKDCCNLMLRMKIFQTSISKRYASWKNNLKTIVGSARKEWIANVALSVIQSITPFLLIICIKILVDKLTHTGSDVLPWLNLTLLIVITALIFLLNGILSSMHNFFFEKFSHTVTQHIYQLLHKKHTELGLSCYEDPKLQDKMYRAVQEAGYRPVKIMSDWLIFLKSLTAVFVMLFLFLGIKWYLLILLLFSVIPSVLVRLKYARKRYRMKDTQSSKEREMAYFNRILTGSPFAKELRLFGFSDFALKRFRHLADTLFQEKQHLQKSEMLADMASQIFAVLLIFMGFLSVVWLMTKGAISIGSVVLFFFLFQRGYSVLSDLLRSVASLIEDDTYLNDFFSFLNLPVQQQASSATSLAPLREGITVENLRFRYESSQRDALASISLKIPAGKTVALVGPNGSGKTTLVKLLCGFYTPQEGYIRYDGIDIKTIDQNLLRRQIAAVFQDYALYNVTAYENIGLGNIMEPLDKEKARQAVQAVGLSDLMEHLPSGYDTLLGTLFKSSEDLSIGQWQKLAIARAVYRHSPIVFMDEPSSALDAASERQLLANLRMLTFNKTVVIISHRLSTVQWADIIYVMDNGRIVESGNHQALMDLRGTYYAMYCTDGIKSFSDLE